MASREAARMHNGKGRLVMAKRETAQQPLPGEPPLLAQTAANPAEGFSVVTAAIHHSSDRIKPIV